MSRKRIIIFGSGSGSNFEAIVKHIRREGAPIDVLFVFSENPDAYILERAKRLGIERKVVDYKKVGDRKKFNSIVMKILQEAEPFDLLVLAGYMKILPPEIVRRYEGKIINIHPALLPSFRGLHAIERAFNEGVKVTGVSVHYVDEGVDTGPIIAQVPVRVEEGDTIGSLEEKIHRVEHFLYYRVIKRILFGEIDFGKRALISVTDKKGIDSFAKELRELGFEIVSTGGTSKYLEERGIEVTPVEFLTGFKEILKGKVKTLNPLVFGGILGKEEEREEMAKEGIPKFHLVCVNFYKLSPKGGREHLESMDIGGPALLRASVKNYREVIVVTDPSDYPSIIKELRERGDIPLEMRKKLALKALYKTISYDYEILKAISSNEDDIPRITVFSSPRKLRYGENPHQRGWILKRVSERSFLDLIEKIHGDELSYNNYIDLFSAFSLIKEFKEPACSIIKHTNPCGVSEARSVLRAFINALEGDPLSAFGGIVAFNRKVERNLAEELNKIFLDMIIAPMYEEEAIEILKKKKRRRIIRIKEFMEFDEEERIVGGDLLLQQTNKKTVEFDKVEVIGDELNPSQKRDVVFASIVGKHLKSNAAVVVKERKTLGIGCGQQSRVGAVELALNKAGQKAKGAILYSDGFFPFPDSVEKAARFGIEVIVQPGGSIRDEEVIKKAKEEGITMVLTGIRHFRH